MVKRYGVIGVVLLLMLLVMSAATAEQNGTNRPFKGKVVGEATFDLQNPNGCPGEPVGFGITTFTDGEGNASHLGKVSAHYEHCPLFDGSLTEGRVVFEAANGDELHGEYFGTATPPPPNIGDPIFATSYITFDPIGSTGRFAGATGSAVSTAEVVFEGFADPSWPFSATWSGTLSY